MEYVNNVGYINKVELQGVVGSIQENSFSLLTIETFKSSDGNIITQNTWHNIRCADTSNLMKMDMVHIIGRIKAEKYINSNGETVSLPVVIATEINHV